jgi:ubiquinone biosynthesis protein
MRIVRPVYRSTKRLQKTVSDLGRLREVATVLARHGLGFVVSGLRVPGVRIPFSSPDTTPERVVSAIQELGPTWVKFGQLWSTRVDLLPPEYIKALQTLQDEVKPVPIRQVHHQLEASVGSDWREQLMEFEDEPLATGSVAMVHRARLTDGTRVVVKVLRPGIRETIKADLSVLELLAKQILSEFPEASYFDPLGMLREFERSIADETDFEIEAQNAERFRANFADVPEVTIPRVHRGYGDHRVMVMDEIVGVRIREARAAGFDMEKVGQHYLSAAYRMLFDHGFFHGDLHPGNVFVEPDGKLGIIDFGMVGRLTPEMKDNLVAIVFALERGDFRSIARIYYDIGIKTQRVDFDAFERDVVDVMERNWVGRSVHEVQIGAFLKDLADGAVRYKLQAPPNYTMFFKALITTEGLAKALVSEVDPIKAAAPYIHRMVRERFQPGRLREELFYTVITLRTLQRRVPAALTQLLEDIQNQRLQLQVTTTRPREERASEHRRNTQLLIVSMSVASLLGGSIALDMEGPALLGVPWVSWVLYCSSAAFWLGSLVVMFLNRKV